MHYNDVDAFLQTRGLITPVESGQSETENEVVENARITKFSENLINFLKSYETGQGRDGKLLPRGEPALYPYQGGKDAAGTLTIGWGHAMETEEEGWFSFSDGIKINLYTMKDETGKTVDEITKEQAEEILAYDIRIREEEINHNLEKGGIECKVDQQFYDALFDMLYQIGINHMYKDDDLSTFLDEENFDLKDEQEIKEQFGEYTNGGKEYAKLRRADELDIIFNGDYTRNDENCDRYGEIWGIKTMLRRSAN